jgi:hypothetical protein
MIKINTKNLRLDIEENLIKKTTEKIFYDTYSKVVYEISKNMLDDNIQVAMDILAEKRYTNACCYY